MKKTMTEDEFRAYFNRVESYFALKRKQAIMLSPEEFELVEDLYKRGVRLELVLRGIDRFFEKKKKSTRKAGRRPVFLTHVLDDIESVVADYDRKGVGSHLAAGPTETEFMVERLNNLLHALQHTDPTVQPIADQVSERITVLRNSADSLTMDEMEAELESVFQFSRKQISDKLNPETVKAVQDEVEELSRRAGSNIAADILARFQEERLLDALQFPVITLFG